MKIKRFQLGALWTNCYVVWSETGDAVVADPGGPMDEVRDFIARGNLRVQKILLTHGHGDHIMGLNEIRGDAPEGVAIHYEDAGYLTNSAMNLSAMAGLASVFDPADSELNDGMEFRAGGMKIRVIFTPGHTRGSCCFYISEDGDALLLSGDTLFARSIGRTDLPGGDEATLFASLEKLSALDDSLPVYPGHGPSTTIGEERRLNPYWPR
jgi:glyoxylase-like metal-dependent hydrolase (beta-lactamase superfamily II)